MRIMIGAYACNPNLGSEEGVGWGWVRAAAEKHEVWVLTASYHRGDIQRQLEVEPELAQRIHFVYVQRRWWHYRPTGLWNRIERSILKPLMNLSYSSWQRAAGRVAAELQRAVGFDLVHQLTYVGFRFPGHLWKLGVPFVWGPIGGLENTPWRVLPWMGLRGAVYYAGRNLINSAQKRWLRSTRRALARAGEAGTIAATSAIRRELERVYGVRSTVISEVGIDETGTAACRRQPGEPLRICWSGLHLQGKGLPLLLEALAEVASRIEWELTILGDGPLRARWERRATRLGIADRCRFLGWLPRPKAVAEMARSHLFVQTSLKDLTSTVIVEAISRGLPVVALAHCGFPDVIDSTCGVLVPLGTRREVVRSIGAAIESLGRDETFRWDLARGAVRRASRFFWATKAREIEEVYRRRLRSRSGAG